MARAYHIAVFEGDGIGPEVMEPCLAILTSAVERSGGGGLIFERLDAGANHYRRTKQSLPEESLTAARNADAILLSAMGLPDIRYPDGTEISPQIELRMALGLYAGVRPIRLIPGVPTPLADPRAQAIDMVVLRESTEGLFASHGKGVIDGNKEARDTLVITRPVSERLFDFAFDLAASRAGRRAMGKETAEAERAARVTCVDKANVFASFAFFRRIFDERAALNPNTLADYLYIDAASLAMVTRPWDLDVLVTENMFGDILSDLGAGLIGGMGMAPSADIGDEHAVFQPCHGSAPDIAGGGLANPTAMILSGAMMLDWLADRHADPTCRTAARLIEAAVDAAFATGHLKTAEFGGSAGTQDVHRTVENALAGLDPIHLDIN